MSIKDAEEYLPIAKTFIGQAVFPCCATNSLKLLIGANLRGNPYIWIDPPWHLNKGNEEITASYLCPLHTEDNYDQKFSSWAEMAQCLNGSVLASIEASANGSLEFYFQNGYILILPPDNSTDDTWWYVHWYAKA